MEKEAIYRKALDKWGPDAQMGLVVEECAELIAAINKFGRNRATPLPALLEEIADVEIMIEQMHVIFDSGLLDQAKHDKLARLAKRVMAT